MPDASERYLDLMKRILLNTIYQDPRIDPGAQSRPFDPEERRLGRDWPRDAHTMIGRVRLDNLEQCCRTVISERVPGDFFEAGVWRGGAAIFMRAVLAAFADDERRVILADSFRGLPPPDPERYPADKGDALFTFEALAVSLEQVRENFDRYGLLDERVVFLEGWFKDTLPAAPVDHIAVLRLDGDMYESTWQALEALYDKVSPRGFVIVDDYGCIPACAQAVTDFRSQRGIEDPIMPIDWTGVYWRKRST